jgi:hypothetical protein
MIPDLTRSIVVNTESAAGNLKTELSRANDCLPTALGWETPTRHFDRIQLRRSAEGTVGDYTLK